MERRSTIDPPVIPEFRDAISGGPHASARLQYPRQVGIAVESYSGGCLREKIWALWGSLRISHALVALVRRMGTTVVLLEMPGPCFLDRV